MRTASLAVLTSVIGCTSMKPGSGTSPSSSGVAPVVPAADDDYAALWYQGGRQVGGTALAEAEALGRAFTLAGYALDTDHGPVVQRITNIAVCDGVATWPPDVRGTWVVATGRLERAEDCEPTSGIGLRHESNRSNRGQAMRYAFSGLAGTTAPGRELRAVAARITQDEAAHEQLSWNLHEWFWTRVPHEASPESSARCTRRLSGCPRAPGDGRDERGPVEPTVTFWPRGLDTGPLPVVSELSDIGPEAARRGVNSTPADLSTGGRMAPSTVPAAILARRLPNVKPGFLATS